MRLNTISEKVGNFSNCTFTNYDTAVTSFIVMLINSVTFAASYPWTLKYKTLFAFVSSSRLISVIKSSLSTYISFRRGAWIYKGTTESTDKSKVIVLLYHLSSSSIS